MKSLKFFKPTLAITLAIVIAWLLSVRAVQAGYTVTLQQVGPDVVATGSGPIDLTGLSKTSNSPFTASAQLNPNALFEYGKGFSISTGAPTSCDFYDGNISGPISFALRFEPQHQTFASSGSGDMVGIGVSRSVIAIGPFLRPLSVPAGYVSGTALSDSATYNRATFATLNVRPGTYVWTWGTGVNQNFTLRIGFVSPPPTPTPTPTPTASPLPTAVSQIDGSGTIAAPRGRKDAQFSIFAVQNAQLNNSQSLEGEFGYLDKKSHIRLTSGNIQTVTINGNQGAFSGIGRLGSGRSKQMVQFTVTVTSNQGAVPDTFSIVLDNGYSASGNLTSGSIRISTVDSDQD